MVLGATGCQLGDAPTPTASSTPAQPDFTRPGAAQDMVRRLIAASGSEDLIMVQIETDQVSVSVLIDSEPVTWAYRDGEIQEVASDMAYVDQAVFTIDDFNISDVGALFRAAEAASGSAENQDLQIVDYSGGQVMMAVSTVPESRTVFFHPDGRLLETLDFTTHRGVVRGLEEAVGEVALVHSAGIDSRQGAWIDLPGADQTTIRRLRTAKVPVTTNARAETLDLPLFATGVIDAEAIWSVVEGTVGTADVPDGSDWSVIIDDRDDLGIPRMHFRLGRTVLVTELDGTQVVER